MSLKSLVAASWLALLAGGPSAQSLPEPGTLDPALRGLLEPALAAWITSTRDAALAQGVEAVPSPVRAALEGYVATEILDAARWRVDDTPLSLQRSLFDLGYTPAITVGHVVIFASADDAAKPALWVHELYHVMQYRDWGVDGFAARYVADSNAVEHDAAEFRWRWLELTGRVPPP